MGCTIFGLLSQSRISRGEIERVDVREDLSMIKETESDGERAPGENAGGLHFSETRAAGQLLRVV
jgi:hypothetical protein